MLDLARYSGIHPRNRGDETKMIQWAKELYLDDHMKKKEMKAKAKMNEGKFNLGVYCIALASNSNNLFDIFDANELKFPHYQNRDIYIIGLSNSRSNAFILVRDMIDEVYQKTGDVNKKKVIEYYGDWWD